MNEAFDFLRPQQIETPIVPNAEEVEPSLPPHANNDYISKTARSLSAILGDIAAVRSFDDARAQLRRTPTNQQSIATYRQLCSDVCQQLSDCQFGLQKRFRSLTSKLDAPQDSIDLIANKLNIIRSLHRELRR